MEQSGHYYEIFFDEIASDVESVPFWFLKTGYKELTNQLERSKIQDASAARILRRSLAIARYLVDDKGIIEGEKLEKLIEAYKKVLYWLGPGREDDAIKQENQLRALEQLRDRRELGRLLYQIDKPYNHPLAESIIRQTMKISKKDQVTKADAVRAALSAWLTPLRQNIGSCFATAPAILVQQEHPEYLLQDLNEILSTGRLTRTFEGEEHQVPLSKSFGIGDLNRQILFDARTKDPFHNLSSSIGLQQAFQEMGMIDSNSANKQEDLFDFLCKAALHRVLKLEQLVLSVEEIMQLVLQHHLEITERDLADYQSRPKQMIHSSLLMATDKGKRDSMSKGQVCALYYQLLEAGKAAFVRITEHPLLKAWEYTLASFAETSHNLSTWNLYSSLGLDPKQPGGIGYCMFRTIETLLEEKNRKVHEFQEEYHALFQQLKMVESRLKNAESEQSARWIRADYQSKRNEFNTFEEMRDRENRKAQKIANLFNALIDLFVERFPAYFQEVYDPDLHEVSAGPYDDTPAGFRLMYKHGRNNTSQWTFVKDYQEFVFALDHFFIAMEHEAMHSDLGEGIEAELSDVVTHISLHIKTDEFILTAFERMAAAHRQPLVKDPLNNLSKIEKKPWAYTSGGGMDSLIRNYFGLNQKPTLSSVWVESPMELCVFLVDSVKKMPYKESDKFVTDGPKSLLIHSPTHAFRFLPGFTPFCKSWQKEHFTYSWIRDYFSEPMKLFYHKIVFDKEVINATLSKLKQKLPGMLHPHFDQVFQQFPTTLNPKQFREHFMDTIRQDRGLQLYENHLFSQDEVDSLLYSHLPFIRRWKVKDGLVEILTKTELYSEKDILEMARVYQEEIDPQLKEEVVSSKELLEIVLSCIMKHSQQCSFPTPLQEIITKAMRALSYLPPPPISFADTNWEKELFAFCVNPATIELELWRMNALGTKGSPISSWKGWLDGSRRSPDWGVYINKHEYS